MRQNLPNSVRLFVAGRNATEAMDLADSWLGVPKLLTPEEIVNPNVDEMSMMTYLSQFPNAKVSSKGTDLRSRIRPTAAIPLCQRMVKYDMFCNSLSLYDYSRSDVTNLVQLSYCTLRKVRYDLPIIMPKYFGKFLLIHRSPTQCS